MLFTPALLLRRKIIIKKLTACGAFSEESAVTLKAAGVFNPRAFGRLNAALISSGMIGVTPDGRYWLNRNIFLV